MAYTTINKSTDNFNTKIWTGDGNATRSFTGVGFQPDFVWGKPRTLSYNHSLTDVIRGVNKIVQSSTDSAEITDPSSGYLSSFDSDGFSVQAGSSNTSNYNTTSENYVAWNWKAGGTGSANTDGSINTTSTSVNTTAGFSISKWTGDGTGGSSIGHGLGVKPEFVIIKRLEGTQHWYAWHKDLGDNYLELNTTTTSASGGLTVSTSTITFPNSWSIYNASGETMICYAFAPITGYSTFGSYSGNTSADGTFIYTGFKPTFLIVKGTTTAESWCMFDNKRNTYNPNNTRLLANANNTEATIDLDFLSNGIKFRTTDNAVDHANTYIYMAFGQTMVGTNDIPATAR